MQYKRIDPKSYFFSLVVLILSWLLFAWETGEVLGTLFAAILTAGLFWVGYMLVRWVVLTLKR